MSQRSTFVTETLAYCADPDAVAAALIEHLSAFSPVLIKSNISGTAFAVAGIARASYEGGEWEDFESLEPFAHDVSILINCEGDAVLRLNLKTGNLMHAKFVESACF